MLDFFLTSGLLRVKMELLELISNTSTSPVLSPAARWAASGE